MPIEITPGEKKGLFSDVRPNSSLTLPLNSGYNAECGAHSILRPLGGFVRATNRNKKKSLACGILTGVLLLTLLPRTAVPHVFVNSQWRAGTNPEYDGRGWHAEVYLDIPVPPPPSDPTQTGRSGLFFAESYVENLAPDFTFETDWIDFPSGPEALGRDDAYDTIGEFIAGNFRSISDQGKLQAPFGTFLIRFSGFLKITFDDDTTAPGLPVWVDFGTMGYDGYRLEVGETIYRWPLISTEDFFWRENPICEAVGLYPITVTFFNQYDPIDEYGFGDVGIELYTWHGSERAWPAGEHMVHSTLGPGSIIPPRVIYQIQDVSPVQLSDFNADGKIDLRDARWFQHCFSGPAAEGEFLPLKAGCLAFDFDGDRDIDLGDYLVLDAFLSGPE